MSCLQAVKMTSVKTQIPYEYYSLPFCKPSDGIEYRSENLGKIVIKDFVVVVFFTRVSHGIRPPTETHSFHYLIFQPWIIIRSS